jgi:hypothetical protein
MIATDLPKVELIASPQLVLGKTTCGNGGSDMVEATQPEALQKHTN